MYRCWCLLTLAALAVGCRDSPEVLRFDTTAGRKALVSPQDETIGEQQVRYSFPFVVTATELVRVTDISSSCGCLKVRGLSEKQELQPGEKHSLDVVLNARGMSGNVKGSVTIETDPPAPNPLVLSVEAFVVQPPIASPSHVRGEGVVGRKFEAEARVTRLGPKDEPMLQWRSDASECDGMEVKLVESASHNTPSADPEHPQRLEEHRFRLSSPAGLAVGAHSHTLKLAWDRDLPATTITVDYLVVPKVCHPTGRVLVGTLTPGESFSIRTTLRTNDRSASVAMKDLKSSAEFLHAVAADDGEIEITGTAPAAEGRFSSTVTCSFRDDAIPPVLFDVVGVVNSAEQR